MDKSLKDLTPVVVFISTFTHLYISGDVNQNTILKGLFALLFV